MAQNYFSSDNIHEIADIASHLYYAETLFNRHEWDEQQKRNLQSQINLIKEKQDDKCLNISVIGEFSSGKSTFINALIGYNLLVADVIQGTTVAITVIEYSDAFELYLHNYDHTTRFYHYGSIDELRPTLQDVTTNPEYANQISHITVRLPSETLKNGFRIIDTPGTNSLELWHEEITTRAIREFSDLSLVVIDATRPMTQTLMSFVDSAIGYSVNDCAFIVNKIDLLREQEIDGILRYVGNKATQEFELREQPLVLPFNSLALTQYFDKSVTANFSDTVKRLTFDSLEKLFKFTARRRVVAQARKLMLLIDGMYQTLHDNMDGLASRLEEEMKLLERSRQADLLPFIQTQTADCQRYFASSIYSFRSQMNEMADELVSNAVSHIMAGIESQDTIDKLSDHVKKELKDKIVDEGIVIALSIEDECGKVGVKFKKAIKRFQSEFKREFEKLKILSMQLTAEPQFQTMQRHSRSADIGPVTQLISGELSKENWAIGGGAAAGAVAGSIIFPGVGTVLGALAGAFFGAGAAPKIDKVKITVREKLASPVGMYFRSVANDCLTDLDTYIQHVSVNIAAETAKYGTQYKKVVEQRMADWNRKRTLTRNKIGNVKAELDEISNRQTAIKSIISNLQ